MRIRALLLAAAVALPTSAAQAQAVDATYTVTGSSGNWFLNFNIANGISSPDQFVYFLGVFLSTGQSVAGTPTGWSQYLPWSPWPLGGSPTVYNNTWLTSPGTGIVSGGSLSGFVVHSTAINAPTSVNYFAFSYGQTPYAGDDSFNQGENPGFEGVAHAEQPVTATPEPASLTLMGTGLAGLGGFAFKRRKKTTTA